MTTTVHIPDALLQAIDRRATALKVSRNRYIVKTLERAVQEEVQWSERLWQVLQAAGPEDATLVDDMLDAIKRRRSSKKAPHL